jgi:hypothetical protein
MRDVLSGRTSELELRDGRRVCEVELGDWGVAVVVGDR